ncbi:flagellar assembly protein T N-terminal domain-containing protein [Shewanella sp. JM162201]|uniref:Flagellar assembly protein T N-terminal domain-containing protein n=1 Tax=Shewanella jiangmenensis TaxID=2837387 RepID=A0ABS5UZK1_9GAMM|nr:flagellar assembly protein FlgT [Shewanella jiangmenensis]MBT1443078.1 flagellar assembly protein T N-terminal domain-containing protein [Shewanella jiangmenensis]
MAKFTSALLVAAQLISLPAMADWVEARGEAVIINGDIAKARNEAIEQAISYASLQSGVSFESSQQSNGGQLTGQSQSLYQQMMTGPIQLIDEKVENNRLKVHLRVELMDDPSESCQSSRLKAAILIPETGVLERSQLSQGQLNGLGRSVSTQLAKRLDGFSATGFANLKADMRLKLSPSQLAAPDFRLPDYLANETDSQYILVPQIHDLSTEPANSRFLGLMKDAPLRQFSISLTLFHGISGEILWQQTFMDSAPWEFERNESVSPQSDRFWRSAYGRTIDKVLGEASKELDNVLMCRPVLAQVVAKQGSRVVLNLGRRHGLQVGDELSIVLAKNLPDRLNQHRTIGNNIKTNIKIAQVTEYSAYAELSGIGGIDNIQVSDFAIKIEPPKN